MRRYDSITFPSFGDGCRLRDDRKLRIQGAKRDVNHWYVCFSVERDTVALPESSEEIVVDVGLESFAMLSDGTRIDNACREKPLPFRQRE